MFKIVVGNETGPACYFPKVFNPIIDNKEEEVLPLLNCLVNYEVNEDYSIVNMEIYMMFTINLNKLILIN